MEKEPVELQAVVEHAIGKALRDLNEFFEHKPASHKKLEDPVGGNAFVLFMCFLVHNVFVVGILEKDVPPPARGRRHEIDTTLHIS